MPKPPDPDCLVCAGLNATKAKEVYGESGKGCWDSRFCPKRRYYYRHRSERIKTIALPPPDIYFAILLLYKEPGDRPLHALGAELWRGREAIATLQPVHCFGMTASQIRSYSESVLDSFTDECGTRLRQFKEFFTLAPASCPLRPCPLHPRTDDNASPDDTEPG